MLYFHARGLAHYKYFITIYYQKAQIFDYFYYQKAYFVHHNDAQNKLFDSKSNQIFVLLVLTISLSIQKRTRGRDFYF